MDSTEFDQLKKNPALFLRMYENAKNFVKAWEKGDPVPLNKDNLPPNVKK